MFDATTGLNMFDATTKIIFIGLIVSDKTNTAKC